MPVCKMCGLIMPVNEDGFCFICELEKNGDI